MLFFLAYFLPKRHISEYDIIIKNFRDAGGSLCRFLPASGLKMYHAGREIHESHAGRFS